MSNVTHGPEGSCGNTPLVLIGNRAPNSLPSPADPSGRTRIDCPLNRARPAYSNHCTNARAYECQVWGATSTAGKALGKVCAYRAKLTRLLDRSANARRAEYARCRRNEAIT